MGARMTRYSRQVVEPLPIDRVYSGSGCVERLAEELERLEVRRALLVTGRTLARGELLPRVRGAVGGRVAATFSQVATHNPTSSVRAAAEAYRVAGADGMVAFGGGSVIDCAKAIAFQLEIRPPIVALSTTLSGAEFACSFGQTDDDTLVKGGWRDRTLTPRAIFLDPGLTAETPDWLWASGGMRAVDHAAEAILAPNAHPYLDALAESALTILSRKLVISLTGAEEPRMDCLYAAWMAHTGSYHIQWGLSHQMGRQLGPRFSIPHGHTSAVLLPAVIELQQPLRPEAESCVAEALGVRSTGAGAALRALARQLGLPTTMQEAGISDRAAVEELFRDLEGAREVIDLAW
ncbi:MAG TPA: iron-containing alcohol dehydrogenase [Candidatus Dormibacteraeota bacterium]|nr:iron-containing alcohol dehydrogenase [Candidatus Dormibacteraeota bacterium]